MKFLNPIATKNDIEDFEGVLKVHWKWNVILFKQHWIKLISPLWQSLLSLVILVVIFYIIHANFYEWHEEIYWSLAIFYIATTVLWVIFVIFCIIQNIRKLLGRKYMYYEEITSLTEWRKRYDAFSIWSGVILLFHLIFVIYNIHVPFVNSYNEQGPVAAPIAILVLDLLFIGDILVIMDVLMKYELSYYICSPNSIKIFTQTWFLSVDVTEITPTSINIIKFDKDWLLPLFFHYWNINIYTDSQVETETWNVITLEDVPEPEILVKKIYKIFDREFPIEKL